MCTNHVENKLDTIRCACRDFDPDICAQKRGVSEGAYSCQCECHINYWKWEYWKSIDNDQD